MFLTSQFNHQTFYLIELAFYILKKRHMDMYPPADLLIRAIIQSILKSCSAYNHAGTGEQFQVMFIRRGVLSMILLMSEVRVEWSYWFKLME